MHVSLLILNAFMPAAFAFTQYAIIELAAYDYFAFKFLCICSVEINLFAMPNFESSFKRIITGM